MIIQTKEIYKCEYCNKLYQVKNFAERHEKICYSNPVNDRLCFRCSYLQKKKIEIFYDSYGGETSRIVDLFYCKKIKSFLYPPKVEYKKNAFELGDDPNEPMKTECKMFPIENNIDPWSDLF